MSDAPRLVALDEAAFSCQVCSVILPTGNAVFVMGHVLCSAHWLKLKEDFSNAITNEIDIARTSYQLTQKEKSNVNE